MPDFNTPQTERGPIRFRLRTLLLLVTTAAIGFASLASGLHQAARHRDAAARLSEVKTEIHSLGGWIGYRVSERPNRLQRLLGDPGAYEIQKVRLPGQAPVAGLRHLRRVEEMTRAWELDLNQSRISDGDLKHLRGWKGLRQLDLGLTYITDAGLVHLNGLTGLEVLRLDQTRVTAAGVRRLQESLRETHITPRPRHLTAIAEIERLGGEVSLYPHPAVVVRFFHPPLRPRVTDAVLAHVMQLADLRTWVCLDLSETAVTDAGLKQLKDLSNILELDLSKTRITDAGLVHLKELPDLTRLSLRGTEVTNTGLKHLQALTPLGRQSTRGWPKRGGLNLIDTQVTEDGVRSFRKALPDCNIER